MCHLPLLVRRLLLFVIPLLLLAGCTGYRLGTGSALAFKSVYIPPVESQAGLPQARAVITSRIREDFLRDARVTLADSPDTADAVLHITLKSFGREAAVAQTKDTGLARKFALTLTAECDLTLHDGRVLFAKRLIRAQREDYVDGGQLQSEYEMVPVLAESLSRSITHAVLDTW